MNLVALPVLSSLHVYRSFSRVVVGGFGFSLLLFYDSVPFADLAYSLKHCKFLHTKTSAANIETHDSRIANRRGSDADSQWVLRVDVNTSGLMLVFAHRSNT